MVAVVGFHSKTSTFFSQRRRARREKSLMTFKTCTYFSAFSAPLRESSCFGMETG